MRIEISGQGFRDELRIMPTRRANFINATRSDVDRASRFVMRLVKQWSPVLSGRARTTWGMYTPELMVFIDPRNRPNPAESIWRVEDDGMSITQGSDMRPYNYMDDLNAGSSRQAPAMFIDVATERGGDELAKYVGASAEREL